MVCMCTWLCMCISVNVCLSKALPAPTVTILSPASDVLTVGQLYTLTCTVMVVCVIDMLCSGSK